MERYNRNTIRITTGAMIIALFTLLLLMNRQTGGLFEEMFIYILPIPMVIYAAKYGWKSGLLVFAGMAVFSFFFGNFASIFYSISSALLGLVFGTCLYYKRDMTKTMFAVMGLTVLAVFLGTRMSHALITAVMILVALALAALSYRRVLRLAA